MVDQTPRVWKNAHRSFLVDDDNGEVIVRRKLSSAAEMVKSSLVE